MMTELPFGRLGPQRALGSPLKSRLWSFGNSVRQHEGSFNSRFANDGRDQRVAQRGDG
jgi:hypothetical protein